ncbi:hypothetical protein [Streptomyces sp. HUAS TT7]|uniref:hypothetical protein n=1 Tax=Streptomyces sp. HUAS TT7 TaxID=3447507 RepID=UPI003F65DA79
MRDLLARHGGPDAPPGESGGVGELPEVLEEILTDGWVVEDDGAVLLKGMLDGYHPAGPPFTDLVGREAAVNGWGVPDWDLPEAPEERTPLLLARTFRYARRALAARVAQDPSADIRATVSVSRSESGEQSVTSHVTFWTHRDGEAPHVAGPETVSGPAVAVMDPTDLMS